MCIGRFDAAGWLVVAAARDGGPFRPEPIERARFGSPGLLPNIREGGIATDACLLRAEEQTVPSDGARNRRVIMKTPVARKKPLSGGTAGDYPGLVDDIGELLETARRGQRPYHQRVHDGHVLGDVRIS
jgi:hypothetical protein